MRNHEGVECMKELLADGECTAEQLHRWVDEAQRIRDTALSYLRHEKGVWRVAFNRPFGQMDRVAYVETTESDTEEDVRRWQQERVDSWNSRCRSPHSAVHIVSISRATEADLEELVQLTRF